MVTFVSGQTGTFVANNREQIGFFVAGLVWLIKQSQGSVRFYTISFDEDDRINRIEWELFLADEDMNEFTLYRQSLIALHHQSLDQVIERLNC